MGASRGARVVRARAHAKINLTLRVLGVGFDGYHALRTTFQTLALHDTLTFRFARGPFQLESTDPACPADERNLVWRAAERIWRATGRRGAPDGVQIRLTKRIPMQSGLGGGSSDAAATLRALAEGWRAALPFEALQEIAASLGADVPFFLRGGTALGLERGDRLFPLPDLPATWVTIAIPPFGVSTAEAYGWWEQQDARLRSERLRPGQRRSASARSVRRVSERGCRPREASATLAGATVEAGGPASGRNAGERLLASWLPEREFTNDLQGPVVAHHPEIGRLVGALRRAGAQYAAMSGSGSAVFGLFRGRRAAEAARRALDGRGGRALVTRTCGRTRR